jgi:hypothetical protein
MEQPFHKVFFIFFAIFLLGSCGTATGALIMTPSTISEYPTALVQPYSGPGLGTSTPFYPDSLPLYTPVSPLFTPISLPISQPQGINSPVFTPDLYQNLPVYSLVIPEIIPLKTDYGTDTPAYLLIPIASPSSVQPGTWDDDDDTGTNTVPAFSNPISSGTILIDSMFPRGLGELNIRNARTDKDAVAILVRSGSLEPLIAVYIEAGEKNTMKGIQDGNYVLYYALGQEWNSFTRQFTKNGEYYRSSNQLTYATTSKTTRTQFEWSWTVYDITIGYGDSHPVAIGKSGFPTL